MPPPPPGSLRLFSSGRSPGSRRLVVVRCSRLGNGPGSAGNHLIRPIDINAPTPAEIVAAGRGIATCDQALAAANNPANCINLARPYRGFGAITDRQTSATSRYHGLLTSYRLRPTHGLTAQVAYTWSKNMTDATNDRDAIDVPQDRTNLQLEAGALAVEPTNVIVASYVYEVPTFDSGFAKSTLVFYLFSGWELAGITTAQSGLALNRVVQAATTVPARGSRPNIVGDPLVGHSHESHRRHSLCFQPIRVSHHVDRTAR